MLTCQLRKLNVSALLNEKELMSALDDTSK